MAKEIIFQVEESIEGGYEARALGYSIFTEAETYEEMKEAIRDAIECHFNDDDMPQIIRLQNKQVAIFGLLQN